MLLKKETIEIINQAVRSERPLSITIHEYYLTLEQKPTHFAISLNDGAIEHPLPERCKTTETAQQAVLNILEMYDIDPVIYSKEHFRRATNY